MTKRIPGPTFAVAFLAPSYAFAEVGETNFSLQSTRDLYELCID